ncbi:Taurine catabolism dioxygenase TauD, TfdA family [Fontimonas thermophila]|uniref:Taurine catabolism dioxygenase TauD, TfdA family n=1 Tax=Fontimonas thermophila TaxID=1076937 RepID=A0A1I2JF13_9GAMM|nr:TauD/TfdA family dioxygenase [Fontimonas thermophila]SFF53432.1 Taurine catabolism dioxygenase TauD, TfdA family [Fontimonas thermophila]
MYKSLRAQTLHYLARPHERVPTAPIDSPAAWRGEDMRQRTDWQYRLSPAEIQECLAAVRHARATGKPMHQLTRHDLPLPTLAPRIAQWRHEIRHGRGFVLIRGMPVGHWHEADTEIFYWGLGHHLGIPGAQNPQGDLLGHVRDQRIGGDVRYYRTNKALLPHTDTADIVGLLCLKKARSGGLSRIASSVAVFNEFMRRAPHLVPRLFEPFWFDTKGEGGIRAFPVAPCRYAGGELRTFWQADYFRSVQGLPGVPPLSATDLETLDTYDAISEDPRLYLDMDLEPGDIQLISNHTILHARTAFEDHPEPERRRHLLRLWLSIPEKRPLYLEWLRLKSLFALTATAAVELLRERRRRAFAPATT